MHLVIGGAGALGAALINVLKNCISVDLTVNAQATHSILLKGESISDDWTTLIEQLNAISPDAKLESVVCAAGGWTGGNLQAPDLFETIDQMHRKNVQPAVIAARLASRVTDPGAVVLIGSLAALDPTPNMVGYGLAKAAVHQLAQSVGAVCLLPQVLDTESNRKYKVAPISQMTPLDDVAQWIANDAKNYRGRFVKVVTADGKTTFSAL